MDRRNGWKELIEGNDRSGQKERIEGMDKSGQKELTEGKDRRKGQNEWIEEKDRMAWSFTVPMADQQTDQ